MSDYNLGTAHGRIVIEYDGKGGKQAQADFQAVADKASWLSSKLRAVGGEVAQFASSFGSDMNRVGRSVAYLAGAASILTLVAGGARNLGTSLVGLRGGVGAVMTLVGGMKALPASVQGFPNIIKQVILLSAGLAAFKGGMGILASLAGRFTALRGAAPVLKTIGDGLFNLGKPVRAIAGVALAIGGLIQGVGIATGLAKSVLSLAGAFGALSGVIGIIGGLIGALGQLAGVLGILPGLGFAAAGAIGAIATGFMGFSDALSYVAPAAGGAASGMNQAANAAKNAARQIASATRSVEDALRDQARTVRDTARQIASAQQAIVDAVEAAAEANANAAKAVVSAQRDLADAVADAAKVAVDSARRIADAQKAQTRAIQAGERAGIAASRSLVSAIKNERSAQLALNDAREAAIQNLKDLQELVSDTALDQEGAAIALIEAQKNLDKVNNDALSTDLDKRKAAYELAVAQERVSDVQKDGEKAAQDLHDAQEKGVEGNQAVIDANDALKDSQQSVIDAQEAVAQTLQDTTEANADAAQNLADAVQAAADDRIAAERRVSDASAALSDAQAAQSKTAADGARSIAEAQNALALAEESAAEARADAARRVEDAYRQLAEAQEDAAQSMASAASAAAGAVDPITKLSPAAQDAVRAIRELQVRFEEVKKAVQEKMFAGIGAEIRELTDLYIPVLKDGLSGIGEAVNVAFKEVSAFLKNADTVADFGTAFDLVRQIILNLAPAIQPILEAFRDIGMVGLQVFEELTRNVGGTARTFADFVAEARKTGDLRKWIEAGIQGFRDLWTIVSDLYTSIKLFFSAVTGSDGGTFLSTVAGWTTNLREFMQTVEAQEGLRAFGQFIGDLASGAMALLKVAFENLWPVVVALAPLFRDLAVAFGTTLGAALTIVGPILKGIADTLSFLSPVLAPLLGALFGLGLAWSGLVITGRLFLTALMGLSTGIKVVTTTWKILQFLFMANPWVALAAFIITLVILIITNWDTIKVYLETAWNWIIDTAKAIWQGIVDFFTGLFAPISADWTATWQGIGDFFTGLFGGIYDWFKGVWNSWFGDWDTQLAGFKATWETIWGAIQTFFEPLFSGIVAFFQATMALFQGDWQGALDIIKNWWTDTWNNINDTFVKVFNDVYNFFAGKWAEFQDNFRRGLDEAGRIVHEFGQNILNFFGDAGTWLFNAGRDIVMGLWNGIAGMGRWLWDQVMNWARTYIPGPILQFLGIASPSKWMRDNIGKMIPAGLMVGIDSMKSKVADTSTAMVENAAKSASAAAAAADLGSMVPPDIAERAADGGLIADATLAARSAAATAVPAAPDAPATAAVAEAEAVINELHLHIAGNLDPTNKLAWNKAMDSIRDGIRTREKVRK